MTTAQSSKQEKQVKELRKYLKQSKEAIPGILVFGGIVLVGLLAMGVFFDVPWSVYLLLLWVVPFGIILDGINIVCITRKLKTLESGVEQANARDGEYAARDR